MTKERLRILMGENIRNERMARNMSIDELAELLELTSGFVGLIERGRRGATAYTLLKLSDIFEMPIDNIFAQQNKAALSMEEEAPQQNKAQRSKIASLISDLTNQELDFVVRMIKGIKTMNHAHLISEDMEDADEGEGIDE